MEPVCVDLETFFSKKLRYGLKTMIPEQYCAHELFNPYLISVSDGAQAWSGSPKEFNWSSLEGRVLLSHNARFDSVVLAEMAKRGWAPKLNPPAYHCTANLAAYTCNRRSLLASVAHLFGHQVDKSYRGVAEGKQWPADYTTEEREQVLAAGRSDATWAWRLWDKYSPQWPEIERRLSSLTIEQGKRGVQIDGQKLNDYIWQSHEMRGNIEKIIPWISESEDESWDEFSTKPTSTKCIAEQCRRVNIPCPPVKSDDEEAYLEWEVQHSPNHPWIKAVTGWRSVNKFYQTLVVIKERLRSDGTLPFSLKYFGAHTGRWSGDARVNMQNQRKRPLLCNEAGLLEMNDNAIDAAIDGHEETGQWPIWVRYVLDFRSLIIPRPGKKMIVSDLCQIEPRILAWLVGDWGLLNKVKAGDSVYVAHARATMGFTGDKMDKNATLYKLSKARILALGYGCGWEKFIAMAKDVARLDITTEDPEWIETKNPFTDKVTRVSGYGLTSKRYVKDFREQNPKICGEGGLWRKLGDAFKLSRGSDFIMTLPSGRKMRYEKVKLTMRLKKDPETGLPRKETVFMANSDGRYKGFYGGKLCENLVQATARDVFAEHLIRLEDLGLTNLFSAHDEAVVEVDQSVTARDVEQAMSHTPDWMPGCPIAAEAKEVAHYLK
jgi:DNA polymerase family A